LKLDSI